MPRGDYRDFSLYHLLLHPAVWFVVATGVIIFGATQIWEQQRLKIAHPENYSLDSSRVTVNEPPLWFNTNLKQELSEQVFSSTTLLDHRLVPKTAAYLSDIPWVQQVQKVTKDPNGLNISVRYRAPVAFVNHANQTNTIVDGEGVVFDGQLLTGLDASRLENDLMHISMPRVDISRLRPWQSSNDERIEFAASLCEYLAKHTNQLGLYRVVTFDLPSLNADVSPSLEIWTKNGTRIIWGSAPGHEIGSEAAPVGKLSAIQSFVKENGELPDFEQRAQKQIDVRSGAPIIVDIKRFAGLVDLLDILK